MCVIDVINFVCLKFSAGFRYKINNHNNTSIKSGPPNIGLGELALDQCLLQIK